MAGEYNDLLTRNNLAGELPRQLADQLIAGLTKDSAARALGTSVQAPTLTNMIPQIQALPNGYWEAQPDGALAQTTAMSIVNKSVQVYPLSTIAVIPQDILDDSEYDIWAALQPKLTEALAKRIDQAAIYGEHKPVQGLGQPSVLEVAVANSGGRMALSVNLTSGSATVPDANASSADVGRKAVGPGVPNGATVASVVAGTSFTLSAAATATVTGGNVMLLPASGATYAIGADVFNTSTDNPSLVLQAAQQVSQSGYSPNGALLAAGWQWRAGAARTQQLVQNPIGSNDVFAANLGGLGMRYDPLVGTRNADAIVGKWDNLLIAIRKDITLKPLTEGVISDDTGKVVMNLAQQSLVGVLVRARVGWFVAQPPVADDSFVGVRSPFSFTYNSGTGAATAPVGVEEPEASEPEDKQGTRGRKR